MGQCLGTTVGETLPPQSCSPPRPEPGLSSRREGGREERRPGRPGPLGPGVEQRAGTARPGEAQASGGGARRVRTLLTWAPAKGNLGAGAAVSPGLRGCGAEQHPHRASTGPRGKHQTLGALNDRNVFPQSSGGQRCKVKVSGGWLPEGPSWA